MSSAWDQWKLKNEGKVLPVSHSPREVKPWDFLNPNTKYASLEISLKRLDICKSCPELIKLTNQCKQCGCIMNLKAKLADATCPIGKW